MKPVFVRILLGVLSAGVLVAGDSQTFRLDHKLQIPGATLKSGEYVFSVEDRLQDRAIIRITDSKKNTHELVLAVPNEKLNSSERDKLLFFPTADSDKQILQGWMCPSCQSALEVVYPKGEAVKITGVSAKPVMAVDPTYDKLPKNLSQDDMKVVTLWLLSPKEITAEQKGKGVEAAKLADTKPKATETASAQPAPSSATTATDAQTTAAMNRATAPPPAGAMATTNSPVTPSPAPEPTAPDSSPAATTPAPTAAPSPATPSEPAPAPQAAPAPVQTAAATPPTPAEASVQASIPTQESAKRHMPHTASNAYNFGLAGVAFILTGLGLQFRRRLNLADTRTD